MLINHLVPPSCSWTMSLTMIRYDFYERRNRGGHNRFSRGKENDLQGDGGVGRGGHTRGGNKDPDPLRIGGEEDRDHCGYVRYTCDMIIV